MRATDLAELAAFEAVARHRSFRRAGEERGVGASAISHAVAGLEARLGVRLLNRTTRSVSPTDAGARLLAQLTPAFDGIGSALDEVNRFRDSPFGKVRINAPSSVAPFVLGPALGPLLEANPHLELEVVATDRLVDIVAEGFDAGIRLGESLSEGMTAVRIRPALRFAVVASPAYLARRGTPLTPRDLAEHACLQNLYPSGRRYPWEFRNGAETVEFQPSGAFASDDHALLVRAAIAGLGLAYVWEAQAERAIHGGALMRVLDPWCEAQEWLHLYFPSRRHVSAGLRAVIEALRAR